MRDGGVGERQEKSGRKRSLTRVKEKLVKLIQSYSVGGLYHIFYVL